MDALLMTDQLSREHLLTTLTERLRTRVIMSGSRMSPELSYGRHRGPVPANSRVAAVLVALYQHPQLGWTIPLTKRPDHLEHHPGQICFPGGRVEAGEDLETAAFREFVEELGCEPHAPMVLGQLTSLYVYASRNHVHPIVCVMECPKHFWRPDPNEVAEVIELPIQRLLDPAARIRVKKTRQLGQSKDPKCQFSFIAPAFEHDGDEIWGATAMLLDELATVLQA